MKLVRGNYFDRSIIMSILQNAIDSIELGVEDYKTDDPKRLLSAVRNFYAGIMLLFKHKLASLSQNNDEALIKQQVQPVLENGQIVWKGKGKKTVDFQKIKDRFESLGIKVDWEQLKNAQEYRNNIEHYYDKDKTKPEAVRQYISGCFIIIRDFILQNLGKDPKDLFDPDIWKVLVEEQQVYEAEKNACCDALEKLEWQSDTTLRIFESCTCADCSSSLIQPLDTSVKDASDSTFQCRVCDEQWSYEELLPLACEKESEQDHLRIRDGGDPTFAYCPNCSEEYYNTDEEVCVQCGAKGPYNCSFCGALIPIEELPVDDGNLCGYCHHKLNKDD